MFPISLISTASGSGSGSVTVTTAASCERGMLALLGVRGFSGSIAGWNESSTGNLRVYWRFIPADGVFSVTVGGTGPLDAILQVFKGAQVYDQHDGATDYARLLGPALVSFNPAPGTEQGLYAMFGVSGASQDIMTSPDLSIAGYGAIALTDGLALGLSGDLYPGSAPVGPYELDIYAPVALHSPGRGGVDSCIDVGPPPTGTFYFSGATLTRPIACNPGDTVVFSIWVNGNTILYPQQLYVDFMFLDAAGNTITELYSFGSVHNVDPALGWFQFIDGHTPTNPDTRMVTMRVFTAMGSGETGHWFIDDISLKVNGVEMLTYDEQTLDTTSPPPWTVNDPDTAAYALLLRQVPDPYISFLEPDHGLPHSVLDIVGFDLTSFEFAYPSFDFTVSYSSDIPSHFIDVLPANLAVPFPNFIRILSMPDDAYTGPIKVRTPAGESLSQIDWVRDAASGGWTIGSIGFPGAGGVPRRYPPNLLTWRQSTLEETNSLDYFSINAPYATMALADRNPNTPTNNSRQGQRSVALLDYPTDPYNQIQLETISPDVAGGSIARVMAVNDPLQFTGMVSFLRLRTDLAGVSLYLHYWLGGVHQGVSALPFVDSRNIIGWTDMLYQVDALCPVDCDAIALEVNCTTSGHVSGGPHALLDRLGLFDGIGWNLNDWTPGD